MSEEVLGFSTATPLIPHLVRVELVREGPWPVGESIRMPAEVFTLLQPHAARLAVAAERREMRRRELQLLPLNRNSILQLRASNIQLRFVPRS